MSCKHSNPPGYAFCAACGEALPIARCRCGFAVAANELYCGRCGTHLSGGAGSKMTHDSPVIDVDRRYNLEHLAAQAAQDNLFLETDKARVTQDDIRKLLSKRRKKF